MMVFGKSLGTSERDILNFAAQEYCLLIKTLAVISCAPA